MINSKYLISFANTTFCGPKLKQAINEFNPNHKTIIFIEPYGAVISLLKRGIERNFNIIILTANSDLRVVADEILKSVKLAIQINTMKHDEVLNLIIQLRELFNIDCVIPGFEYFVPMAAHMNFHLGLSGLEKNQVMYFRCKDLMRQKLKNAGIALPRFSVVSSLDELETAIHYVGFPAVCKPIDAAGSVHVRKANNRVDAKLAATRILYGNDVLWGYRLSNTLLMEEYIHGKEYSVEGVVSHGKVTYFSITEKFVADEIEFIEIGHIANVPLEAKLAEKIFLYISNVIRILGADFCPFHAEIRINEDNQPILMEIAARLAGDRISELINLAKSINYFDDVYAAYLGEDILLKSMQHTYAGIRFFYRPQLNSFSSIEGLNDLNQFPLVESCFYYSPQHTIPSFPKPLRRLGHVIMKHDNYDYLKQSLNELDNLIHFLH